MYSEKYVKMKCIECAMMYITNPQRIPYWWGSGSGVLVSMLDNISVLANVNIRWLASEHILSTSAHFIQA